MINSENEMGFEVFGYGVPQSSSSPPSNLSAFAPPFTYGRSFPYPASGPSIDLNDPSGYSSAIPMSSSQGNHPQNTFLPGPEFSFYTDCGVSLAPQIPSQLYDETPHLRPLNTTTCNSEVDYMFGKPVNMGQSSFVEASSYYPTYAPPAIHGDGHSVGSQPPGCAISPSSHVPAAKGSFFDEYYSKLSDMEDMGDGGGNIWKFRGWEYGDSRGQRTTFPSIGNSAVGSTTQNNYKSQGTRASESLSINIEDIDDRAFLGTSPAYTPCTHFQKPISRSTSLAVETDQQMQYQKQDANAWNFQMPPSTSYWNCPSQPNYGLTGNESFEAVFGGLSKDASCVGISSNDGSSVTGSSPLFGDVHFDASQHARQPQLKDDISAEPSECNKELSEFRKDSNNGINSRFDAVSRVQNPCGNEGDSNEEYGLNGAVKPAENISGNSDFQNPPIDSPCWKGIYSSPFTSSKPSNAVPPLETQEMQVFSSLNPDASLLCTKGATDGSSLRSSLDLGFHENMRLDSSTPVTPKELITAIKSFIESGKDEAVKPNFPRGVKHASAQSSSFRKQTKDHCNFSESSSGSVSNTLDNTCQCTTDRKMTCEEVQTGRDTGLEKPDTDVILNILDSEDSAFPINAGSVLKTIHNLSELILFHCSNDTCKLEENDYDVLNGVIQNLSRCLPKNGKKDALELDSRNHQKAATELKVEALDPQINENNLEDQSFKTPKRKNLDAASEMRDHTVIVQVDDMTQAIKKVLNENFHEEEAHPQSLLYKNLWLEAEAALSSITYKARFNRIKAEMERCQSQPSNDILESFPSLALKEKAETEKRDNQSCSNPPVDILARLDVLKKRDCLSSADGSHDAEESSSKLSNHLESAGKLTVELKSTQAFSICCDDPSVSRTNCHADDIMARLHILKSRGDPLVENAIGMGTSHTSCHADDVTAGAHILKSHWDSLVENAPSMESSYTSWHADDVMARFLILKSRGDLLVEEAPNMENSSFSVLSDLNKCDNLAHTEPRSLENSSLQNSVVCSGEQKVEIDESYLTVKDASAAESQKECHFPVFRRLNDIISSGWYDDSSLDWEHVGTDDEPGVPTE